MSNTVADTAPTQEQTGERAAPVVDTDRDAILAELAANRPSEEAAPTAAEAKPVEPTAQKDAAAEPEEADAAEVDDVDPEPPAKVEPKPDRDTERRLAAIQKAEKAQKQAIAAERQALAEERADLATQQKAAMERVAGFEKLLARAKYDPASVLEALGVGTDRFEDVARTLYARSPKGAENPQNRAASEQEMRYREQHDKLSTLEGELRQLREAQEQREVRVTAERQAERHMAGVYKAARATSDAPLVAQMFARNAEKAEQALARLALELAEETGELPDAEDIITTFEKRRRQALEDDGVDVDELLKKPKIQRKPADEKQPAKTLSNDLSTTTQVRRVDMSEDEERDMILSEIRKLDSSGAY